MVQAKVDIATMVRYPQGMLRPWLREELGRLYQLDEGQRRVALEEIMEAADSLPASQRHSLHRLMAWTTAQLAEKKAKVLSQDRLCVVQSRIGAQMARFRLPC